MNEAELTEILRLHKLYLDGDSGGIIANLHRADLHGTDLRGADLQGADLHGADLQGADLHGTDLQGADLHGTDLQGANLRDADLRGANLRAANLRGADLHGADLHGADLDYTAWGLSCKTNHVKVDRKIAAQLAAHFCVLICDDPDYQGARDAILEFAKTSHRAKDLGLLEVTE